MPVSPAGGTSKPVGRRLGGAGGGGTRTAAGVGGHGRRGDGKGQERRVGFVGGGGFVGGRGFPGGVSRGCPTRTSCVDRIGRRDGRGFGFGRGGNGRRGGRRGGHRGGHRGGRRGGSRGGRRGGGPWRRRSGSGRGFRRRIGSGAVGGRRPAARGWRARRTTRGTPRRAPVPVPPIVPVPIVAAVTRHRSALVVVRARADRVAARAIPRLFQPRAGKSPDDEQVRNYSSSGNGSTTVSSRLQPQPLTLDVVHRARVAAPHPDPHLA